MAQKRWNERTPAQQRSILVGGAVEMVLIAVALVDLARRPATQVRGAKGWWALGMFVQPVGPIAYYLFGRQAG